VHLLSSGLCITFIQEHKKHHVRHIHCWEVTSVLIGIFLICSAVQTCRECRWQHQH